MGEFYNKERELMIRDTVIVMTTTWLKQTIGES